MSELYITGFATLDQRAFSCNGKELCVRNGDVSTDNWLKCVYESLSINYLKFFRMDRLCQTGMLLTEALVQSDDFRKRFSSDDVAMVLANSVSSLDADETFQRTIVDDEKFFPSPAVFVYTLPNIVLGEISIRYQLLGENLFLVNSVFDAAELCNSVQLLFDVQKTNCCLTGWLDVHGNSLRALLCVIEKKQSEISNLRFEKSQLQSLFNRTTP